MQAFPLPRTVLVIDEEVAILDIQGDGIGGVGLQLERVGAGLRCGLDNFQCPLQ